MDIDFDEGGGFLLWESCRSKVGRHGTRDPTRHQVVYMNLLDITLGALIIDTNPPEASVPPSTPFLMYAQSWSSYYASLATFSVLGSPCRVSESEASGQEARIAPRAECHSWQDMRFVLTLHQISSWLSARKGRYIETPPGTLRSPTTRGSRVEITLNYPISAPTPREV